MCKLGVSVDELSLFFGESVVTITSSRFHPRSRAHVDMGAARNLSRGTEFSLASSDAKTIRRVAVDIYSIFLIVFSVRNIINRVK